MHGLKHEMLSAKEIEFRYKKYAVKNANDLSAAISLDALASTIVDKN